MVYEPPKFNVAADVVAFRMANNGALEVLLIERGKYPYEGCWAFPGGFVEEGEDLPVAAERELREETGLSPRFLTQVGAWGAPGRDPRGRVVSAVFLAAAGPGAEDVEGGDDARYAAWHPVCAPPALAFDHDELLEAGVKALRRLCERTQIATAFVREAFNSGELAGLLHALGAIDPEWAAEGIAGAAPDVSRNGADGCYRLVGTAYLKKLRKPIFAFPYDLT